MHTGDDLTRPLGVTLTAPQIQAPKLGEWLRVGSTLSAATAACLVAGAFWFQEKPVPFVPAPQAVALPAEPDIEIVEKIDGTPVVRIGYPAGAADSMMDITDAPPNGGSDPRLFEITKYGPLPRVGTDGATPSDIYARAAAAGAANRPKIAIVVGGLGLNETTTRRSLERLSPDVTLGFAPYGESLERFAETARNDGREIWMQIPMETLDANNNPGTNTLTVDASPTENADRLFRSMGKITGYVGVMNYLGERMLTHEPALAPVLKDISARGLLFAEDAPPTRSLVPSLAKKLHLKNTRSDLVIDTDASPTAIDAALAKLEAIAKKKGVAVGTATALPITIDRLAAWTAKLEAKGIALVPLSSVVKR